MRCVKIVEGEKLFMDGVPQALPLTPREKFVSPFLRGREWDFVHDGVPFPKVYEARGLIVSGMKNGVEEFLADWTAFEVALRVGQLTQTSWVSLLHYDMALEFEPLSIPPRTPFVASIRMANDIGEPGIELKLSLRGEMFREST